MATSEWYQLIPKVITYLAPMLLCKDRMLLLFAVINEDFGSR